MGGGGGRPVDAAASEAAFDFSRKPDLKDLLDKYDVVDIEVRRLYIFPKKSYYIAGNFSKPCPFSSLKRCAVVASTAGVSWVQVCLLAIACLVGLLALIAAVATCCLYSK